MSVNWTARGSMRRHRWRFSLRTLLLLTMIAGPLIGLAGPPLYRIARETAYPPPISTLPSDPEPDCVLYDWQLDLVEDSATEIALEEVGPLP